jgi:hypothetical protein
MSVSRLCCTIALGFVLPLTAPGIRAAEIDKYLPDDTEIVLHANIRQILDSELGRKYLMPQLEAGLKGNAEAQQILSAVGFDSLKDVVSLTVAAPGDSEKKWVMLVHAHVDLEKVRAAVEAYAAKQPDAVKIHKQGNVPFYETKNPKQPAHTFYATFVDNETLVVSPDKDYVLGTIARKEADKPPSLDNKLVELVKKMDAKQSLWLALLPDKLAKALPQNNQTGDLAKKVQSFNAGVALTDGVQFSLRVQTPDAKAAREMQQTLKGIQAILILAITSNEQLKDFGPTLTDIVNSIKFTLDKTIVGLDLNISAKQIEEGLKK